MAVDDSRASGHRAKDEANVETDQQIDRPSLDLSAVSLPDRPFDESRLQNLVTWFSRISGYVALIAAVGTIALIILR